MCGVELAIDNLVPHRGPADFAPKIHLKPPPCKKTELLRDDPKAAVSRLLAERGPVYAAAADLTIDTSEHTADQVVREIQQALARSERWKSST